MPATGLPDVKQKIELDAAGYVRGSDEIVIQAIRMAKENRELISTFKDMMGVEVSLAAVLANHESALGRLMTVSRDVINVQKEMNAAQDEVRGAFGRTSDVMRMHADQTNELIGTYGNMGDAARNVTLEQHAVAQSFLETLDPLDRLTARYGGHQEAAQLSNDIMDRQVNQLVTLRSEIVKTGEAVARTSIFAAPFTPSGGTTTAFTGDNSVTAYAASLASARQAAAEAEKGIIAAQLAPIAGGGGGGRGGVDAAIAAAMGGGGGGGGGGTPSFVPWRGGGLAAVRFWGMMAAEVGATVVPALAAAGSAALVGMQSVEAMVPRYQAIFRTSEALGGAFNMTTGRFLGGGSALQQAQNAFQGGGYDIAGNLLSIMQGGGGQGFIKMGEDTLGMLARGTSAMALNFTQGTTGKKLSDALGGGPGYLRQFGDVFSNLGNTLLNVAPNLPGVGGDILGALQGGTGFLAGATRDIPGPVMGSFLAYEAASRWLPAILGGKGLIGRMLGLGKVGGVGGLLARGGTALAGMGAEGGLLEGLGGGLIGAGGLLAEAGGPLTGGAGILAYLIASGLTAKSGPGAQIAALQAQVGASGFAGAFTPLGAAITTATGLSVPGYKGAADIGIGFKSAMPDRFPGRPQQAAADAAAAWGSAAQGFTQTMGNLINSGPLLQDALKKAGLKGVGLADAFQIAQNALLDTSHAFDKHGKLTAVAQQMVTAYAKVIGPMTQSPGAFGAAVGAQTIMSQGAMQSLAKVNAAMDSYQAIIAGGPLGAAGLAAGAGAAPAGAIAKGLTGYTSPVNAAAWQAFASTSAAHPGFITQAQQFGDQMRTYLTLGTATLAQTKGFSASELQRILPQAKDSPAALAMLMQQGAAAGVTGYYDTSKTLAQNYKDVANSLHSAAYNSGQFKKNMDAVTVKTSNIPAVAAQFADATAATVQSQRIAKAAQDAMAIQKAAAGGGAGGPFGGGTFGRIDHAAVSDLVGQLRAAGVQGGAAMKASLDAVLSRAGVGKAMRVKIEAEVAGTSAIDKLKTALAALHGKHVTVTAAANAAAVVALQNAIASVHSKSVTVTVTTINRMITQFIGATTPSGGIAGATLVGGGGGMRITRGQTGGLVPGTGSGDITPAMLEPGEAIIPRYLVPLIAPFLAAHRVPGFGGMPQSSSSHFADGGFVPHVLGFPDPTTMQGTAGKFAWTLIDGITRALNTAGAKKIADALVTKIGQEVALAKNVSAAAMQGQGFGNAGIFGNMDVTPGTGSGSVYEQMQSYVGTVQSFTKDIATLRKQHLNKAIISNLIGAGPVQGDALAQSIMNDFGGVKGVNSLWAQLGSASKGLGAQAAMAQFGGVLAPNLKSGSFSSTNVSISINAGPGATLSLSDAQIKQVVAKIQAALLKQAKRNPKTGLQLSGKGA
jgi:hypothetical protein